MGSQISRRCFIAIICLTPGLKALRTLEVKAVTEQSEGRHILYNGLDFPLFSFYITFDGTVNDNSHTSHNPSAAFLSRLFTFATPRAVKSLFTTDLRMGRRVDSFSANAQVVSTFFLLFCIVLAQTFILQQKRS
jgi:hypothetical protein